MICDSKLLSAEDLSSPCPRWPLGIMGAPLHLWVGNKTVTHAGSRPPPNPSGGSQVYPCPLPLGSGLKKGAEAEIRLKTESASTCPSALPPSKVLRCLSYAWGQLGLPLPTCPTVTWGLLVRLFIPRCRDKEQSKRQEWGRVEALGPHLPSPPSPGPS